MTLLNPMKILKLPFLFYSGFWLLSILASDVQAQIVVPGADGSDLDLTIPSGTNVVIDLSQAATGTWNMPSPVPGNGVYDPQKWAVVFKYKSVTIGDKSTVTFTNHPSRAPVVWLVSGDVMIQGQVSLNGKNIATPLFNEPGPGGFRGGLGRGTSVNPPGGGLGPGGGANSGQPASGDGTPGLYATAGGYVTAGAGSTYGNSSVVPLIGGSGAGGQSVAFQSGGAGGGAILIAAQGTIAIDGSLTADGDGYPGPVYATDSGGSGGAIRLIANSIIGSGTLSGISRTSNYNETTGGNGRVRLEANRLPAYLIIVPFPSTAAPGAAAKLWPDSSFPTVRVKSVAGVPAPAEPAANLDARPPDISYSVQGDTDIVVESVNLPSTATVTVRIVPNSGTPIITTAAYQSGDVSLSLWKATATIPVGPAAIQVRAVSQ